MLARKDNTRNKLQFFPLRPVVELCEKCVSRTEQVDEDIFSASTESHQGVRGSGAQGLGSSQLAHRPSEAYPPMCHSPNTASDLAKNEASAGFPTRIVLLHSSMVVALDGQLLLLPAT